jgi:hypothetical protein
LSFLLLEETRDDSNVATGVNYGVASSLSFELGLSLYVKPKQVS